MVLVMVALAPQALADTTIGVRGGLVPKQRTGIHLRSHDLKIGIAPDGEHYDVSATYVLSNAGSEATLRFGIPLLFVDDDPDAPRRAAASVRIKVGEKESRCSLAKETTPLDASQYESLEAPPLGGWCTARLTIPQADAVAVLLTYRGDLLFRDEVGESAFPSFGPRELRHAFFPAGSWVGPVERVTVVVDLGRFAGLEQVVSPPGVVKRGDELTWTLTNVDPKKVPDLSVKVDAEPISQLAELAKYRKASKVKLAAKAATHSPAAGSTVDGDPATTWCVDKPSTDRWIEVTERKISPDYRDCLWQGVFFVGAGSESSARIKRVRLETCPDRAHAKPARVDLPVARVGTHGPWGVILESSLYDQLPKADVEKFVAAFRVVQQQAAASRCVRVSILEVEGSGPACIGELMPLRSCG